MPLPRRKNQQQLKDVVEVGQEAREENAREEIISSEDEITCGQPMMLSQTPDHLDGEDSSQEPITNLATFKKRFAMKRKIQEKQQVQEKKQNTVEEIISAQDPKNDILSILSIILVMWTEDFLQTAVNAVKRIVKKAMMLKKYDTKKNLYEMQLGITSIVENLQTHTIDVNKRSLKDFVKSLSGNEYYTTFTEHCFTADESEWIMDEYIEALQEVSCASPTTLTTSRSSTTAHTRIPAVDVDSPSTSRNALCSGGDILKELFTPTSSTSTTGPICQNISRKDGDIFCTWSTPRALHRHEPAVITLCCSCFRTTSTVRSTQVGQPLPHTRNFRERNKDHLYDLLLPKRSHAHCE